MPRPRISTLVVLVLFAGGVCLSCRQGPSAEGAPPKTAGIAAEHQTGPPRILVDSDPESPTFGSVTVTGLDPAEIPEPIPTDDSERELSRVFQLFTGSSTPRNVDDHPPVLGTYSVEAGQVRFTPSFPLIPGQPYVARWSSPERSFEKSFVLEKKSGEATTVVAQVYPTSDQLPENLLKLYIQFSAPMSRGEASRHVHLLMEDAEQKDDEHRDEGGERLEMPFVAPEHELWNRTTDRLTLFFDPGRIKRGVAPNIEHGPPLREGASYRLVVDSAWPDAQGRPLKEPFSKRFRVVAADRSPVRPQEWTLREPTNPRHPLLVRFAEPLDHALLRRVLNVTGPRGRAVPGRVEIAEQETRWSFTPERPWRAGRYQLTVGTELEDLAGNSLRRLFDAETDPGQSLAEEASTIQLDFSVTSSDDGVRESDLLIAGFLAKGLCSGLWVNRRDRDDFLSRDILLGGEALERVEFEVVDRTRRVTARIAAAVVRTAVFHPTHGCTILPEGARDVSFDTSPILPAVPAAERLEWPEGDVVSAAPPEGVDPTDLDAAVDLAFAEETSGRINTRAYVVVHGGRIIAERYADGFDAGSVMVGWSMGKSVTSALIGTAVQRGWLDPDQLAPIAEWRKEGDSRSGIRIRDLLRMSSGLDFVRVEPNQPAFFSADNHHFYVYFAPIDIFRFSTGRPAEHPPNTVGRYRNGDPLSLGRILRETVEAHGKSYLAYPQRALFDRIGARTMVLERDHRGNMILTGFDHGAPRDWARFGLLHLRDGVWQGERILPEGWVELVSSPAPAWPDRNYGGLFWINGSDALPGAPRDAYYAAGAFGQFVVILPSHDLVVVRMGYSASSGAVRESLGRAIARLLEALSPVEAREAA